MPAFLKVAIASYGVRGIHGHASPSDIVIDVVVVA